MKLRSTAFILGCGLFAVPFLATAQWHDSRRDGRYGRNGGYGDVYEDDSYSRGRGSRNRSQRGRGGDFYGNRNGGSTIRQVISNLNRVASNSRVDNHEANHFSSAIRRLQEFDSGLARGNFDQGRLDKAIEDMSDLARADQIHPRDRQIIARDINALRQFRSNGGQYSGQYPRY